MTKEVNSAVELSEKLKGLFEKLVTMNDQNGMTPASARVVSLLVVCNEGELTFDQIRSTLNISKSATSNAIKLLINSRAIEQLNKFGERKRYFRANFLIGKKVFNNKMKVMFI